MKYTVAKIRLLRRMLQDLQDQALLGLPTALQYVLMTTLFISIALCGYRMALTESFLVPFAYTCIIGIYLGLYEVSKQLVDPFGPDDNHLPVRQWVEGFRSQADYLFTYYALSSPDSDDEMVEEFETEHVCCVM